MNLAIIILSLIYFGVNACFAHVIWSYQKSVDCEYQDPLYKRIFAACFFLLIGLPFFIYEMVYLFIIKR
jgi:hypothetical protein